MGARESSEFVQNIVRELRRNCLAPSGGDPHMDSGHLLDGVQVLVHATLGRHTDLADGEHRPDPAWDEAAVRDTQNRPQLHAHWLHGFSKPHPLHSLLDGHERLSVKSLGKASGAKKSVRICRSPHTSSVKLCRNRVAGGVARCAAGHFLI